MTGRILDGVEDPQLIELQQAHGAQYDIEATDDGRYVLTPKLTAEARLGGRPLTGAEFDELFGHLPTGPA